MIRLKDEQRCHYELACMDDIQQRLVQHPITYFQ